MNFLTEKDAKKQEEAPQQDAKNQAPPATDKTKRALERSGPDALLEQKKGEEPNPAAAPEILYGNEDVVSPNLFAIKLQVLAHPSFTFQAKRINEKGGPDAFIIFYWTVIQHQKFESTSAVSAFRNAVLQRGRSERRAKAAEWLAQASPDEYTIRQVNDYLTGRKDKLKHAWEKDPIQTGIEAETQLAMEGEYKSWGRVNAKRQGHFPLVDFVKGDSAVSLKAVNPYDPGSVDRIKNHMEELSARLPGRQVEKDEDGDGEMDKVFEAFKLTVDLRVPPGTEKKVKPLIEHGESLGLQVKITPHGTNHLDDRLRPGDRPALPGEYEECDAYGKPIPNGRVVTMLLEDQEDVLPPTSRADRIWRRVGPPKK